MTHISVYTVALATRDELKAWITENYKAHGITHIDLRSSTEALRNWVDTELNQIEVEIVQTMTDEAERLMKDKGVTLEQAFDMMHLETFNRQRVKKNMGFVTDFSDFVEPVSIEDSDNPFSLGDAACMFENKGTPLPSDARVLVASHVEDCESDNVYPYNSVDDVRQMYKGVCDYHGYFYNDTLDVRSMLDVLDEANSEFHCEQCCDDDDDTSTAGHECSFLLEIKDTEHTKFAALCEDLGLSDAELFSDMLNVYLDTL
jgi:hypothetical protein